MVGLVAMVAFPPLFRARLVPVALGGEVDLADARRDGRAVGIVREGARTFGTDPTHSLVVFDPDAVHGAGTGTDETWSRPVAITGARSFAVEFYSPQGARSTSRRARLVGRRILVGGRAARAVPTKPMERTTSGNIGLAPGWWSDAAPPTVNRGTEGIAEWFDLARGISLGSASTGRWEALSAPESSELTPVGRDWMALIAQSGRVHPLAWRTLGAPSAGFGKVLFVSRAGWLVVTVGQDDGLAWLEPVGR